MADSSPTGRAMVQAVRAALRLVSSSDELLTVSQLLAVKTEIGETLDFLNARIQAEQSDDHKVVLDLSDWESASDGEEEGDKFASAENTVGSNEEGHGGVNRREPPEVPRPYPIHPIDLPDGDKLPDYWYVVDRGIEVGIFASIESADGAVAGVKDGHYYRMKAWYDAVILYNQLYHQGCIILVHT